MYTRRGTDAALQHHYFTNELWLAAGLPLCSGRFHYDCVFKWIMLG